MDEQKIFEFLNFGCFMNYRNINYTFDFSKVDKKSYENFNENDLEYLAYKKFITAIEKNFKMNEKHVVPISGGLDSRSILAGLMEFTEASNISTYTFGTPKTLDYSLGNEIAKQAGTKHSNFPISEHRYSFDELFDISSRVDHQTALFHHPPMKKIDELFCNHTVWSGFFGERLTGSHQPSKNLNYQQSLEQFIDKNTYQNELTFHSNVNVDKAKNLEYEKQSQITPYERLDFLNRQLKFIAPHVLMKGFNYKTPFIEEDLFNFFLSLEYKYRDKQYLYKKMLLNRFPHLFEIGTTHSYGLSLKANKKKVFKRKLINKIKNKLNDFHYFFESPNLNYINFENGFRERDDLKNLAVEQINDLNRRKLLKNNDIISLLNSHLNKKGNFANAIILLISLEIHLKSLESNS